MDRFVLDRIRTAGANREAIALITDLATGQQELVEKVDAPAHPLAGELDHGFRFDRSDVVMTPRGEAFINIYNPPLRVIVIGAVHAAQHVAPIARSLGYAVTVIDPRQAFATEQRFPGVTLLDQWPDEALATIPLDARTAFIALTHDPRIDDPALQAALGSECFYIGALGSRKTHASRLERLRAAGFSDQALARIDAPIGLDIGARGAPEIAVSIMAGVTRTLRLGAASAAEVAR